MIDFGVYYVLDGKKIVKTRDIGEWGRFMDSFDKRIVEKTTMGGVEVSTVFLGIDHGFGSGLPVLFETIIFGGKHDGYQQRYCTWDESVIGHKEAVKMVAEGR